MPFGLDLKSFILGALFVYFVLPYLISLMNARRAPKAAAQTA